MLNIRINYKSLVGSGNWKEINDFPGYIVSDCGDIFSLKTNKRLTLHKNPNGYFEIKIRINGRSISKGVHRIVLENFGPERPSQKHECAHNDGTRINNHISNLRWATRKENQLDRHSHGTFKTILNAEKVKEILLSDEHTNVLAEKYGVSTGTITNVRSKKTWGHIYPDIIARRPSYVSRPKTERKIIDLSPTSEDLIKTMMGDLYRPGLHDGFNIFMGN